MFSIAKQVLLTLVLCSAAGASELRQVPANPDLIGSGVEYHGTLQMKAGDLLRFGIVDLGGFVEVRNEPQFNRGLFPNHNWRGFIAGRIVWPLVSEMQTRLLLFSGLEHESAHATMGIVEPTDDPYGMIYDHQYRKYILNALPAGVELIMFDALQRLVLEGRGMWYFLSKNTPELPGLETGNSGGFSLGGEYRYQVMRLLDLFVSVHERFIFRSTEEWSGAVYYRGSGKPLPLQVAWPVINRTNTVTATAGVSFPLFEARRQCDVYIRLLFGNGYGYIDSREKRRCIAAGLVVWGK